MVQVSILINNAGVGFAGPFIEMPINKLRTMCYLNDLTCMELMHVFLKVRRLLHKQRRASLVRRCSGQLARMQSSLCAALQWQINVHTSCVWCCVLCARRTWSRRSAATF